MKLRVWLLCVIVDHERMVSGITAWGVQWMGFPTLWFAHHPFHDHTVDQFSRNLIFSSCVLSLCLFMVYNAHWWCENNIPAMGVCEWGRQDAWDRTWSSVCCRLEWECTPCSLIAHCFNYKVHMDMLWEDDCWNTVPKRRMHRNQSEWFLSIHRAHHMYKKHTMQW